MTGTPSPEHGQGPDPATIVRFITASTSREQDLGYLALRDLAELGTR